MNPEDVRKIATEIEPSSAFLSVAERVTPDMIAANPIPALQLGVGILLGKPLVFLVRPDQPVAPHLARVADRIVRWDADGDPAGTAADLREAIEDVSGRSPTRFGWFVDQNDEGRWEICLENREGLIPTVGIEFDTREAAVDFMRQSVIGRGELLEVDETLPHAGVARTRRRRPFRSPEDLDRFLAVVDRWMSLTRPADYESFDERHRRAWADLATARVGVDLRRHRPDDEPVVVDRDAAYLVERDAAETQAYAYGRAHDATDKKPRHAFYEGAIWMLDRLRGRS